MKKISTAVKRIAAIVAVLPLLFPMSVTAASVTNFSVNLSRLKASTAANQEIFFVTPTGATTGQTITLAYSSDFTMNAIDFNDIDVAVGSTNVCSSASYTEQTLAGTQSGATWGASLSSQTVTLTAGSGGVTANRCIRIRIGTNAVQGTTGDTQITNGPADDDDTITIGGTFGDSGVAAVDIITDDQVSVTATVDPTITFAISDNTIAFGTLSSVAARYATGDGTNTSTDPANGAHNLTVATNAGSGYSLTYNGATLTDGAKTITPITAGITDDANGTPGGEQFAISVNRNGGNATVASGYDYSGVPDWRFVASTTTTIASETVPTATETFEMHYLANIAGDTEAGAYSTAITYVATGNF